ncbi:MAG: hypothetical protein WAK72_05040, partial [Pseudolabrys sp.]
LHTVPTYCDATRTAAAVIARHQAKLSFFVECALVATNDLINVYVFAQRNFCGDIGERFSPLGSRGCSEPKSAQRKCRFRLLPVLAT